MHETCLKIKLIEGAFRFSGASSAVNPSRPCVRPSVCIVSKWLMLPSHCGAQWLSVCVRLLNTLTHSLTHAVTTVGYDASFFTVKFTAKLRELPKATSAGGGAEWDWPWPWFNPHPSGCIGPHSDAILICQELPPLLLPRWASSFADLSWLCLSS